MFRIIDIVYKHKVWIIFFLLLTLHIFFRFYQLEGRNPFGWDQVDNAWAAKDILVDKKFPLLGMVAKTNSGFYIGPAYYYLITPFYWFFNLDPIASGVFAGVTSIFTFFVLFLITKKIFSTHVALFAVFIHTVSSSLISADRVQWPVNFIAPVSYIIFYALYKIMNGNEKYIFLLAAAIGFSFNIHFTSIFYPIIILFSLPFFPRTKEALKYILFSIPLFLLWVFPIIISEIFQKGSSSQHLGNYINNYYHGFHLRRVLQLANDAFIEFEQIITYNNVKFIKFILFPLFIITSCYPRFAREKVLLSYLMFLWFFIPWMIFSVYSGEISNYYFALTRNIVILIISFLAVYVLEKKYFLINISIITFWFFYFLSNVYSFNDIKESQPLSKHRKTVIDKINMRIKIEFAHGVAEPYIYYVYTRNKKKSQ